MFCENITSVRYDVDADDDNDDGDNLLPIDYSMKTAYVCRSRTNGTIAKYFDDTMNISSIFGMIDNQQQMQQQDQQVQRVQRVQQDQQVQRVQQDQHERQEQMEQEQMEQEQQEEQIEQEEQQIQQEQQQIQQEQQVDWTFGSCQLLLQQQHQHQQLELLKYEDQHEIVEPQSMDPLLEDIEHCFELLCITIYSSSENFKAMQQFTGISKTTFLVHVHKFMFDMYTFDDLYDDFKTDQVLLKIFYYLACVCGLPLELFFQRNCVVELTEKSPLKYKFERQYFKKYQPWFVYLSNLN